MNENPEGTPNPLNPNPAPVGPAADPGVAPAEPAAPAAPVMQAEPAAGPVTPAEPIVAAPAEPTVAPMAEPAVPPEAPAATSIPAAPVAAPVTPAAPVADSATPAGETIPTAEVKPVKKKKTSLIVTLVIFFIVLIGSAAAAIYFLDPFGWFAGNDDRVTTAVARLFSETAPKNVRMNGTISLATIDETSPITSLDVNFTSDINTISTANSANATVTAVFPDESEFKFSLDEVHTEGGDLYIKVGDVASALEEYKKNETNCVDDESGETNCGDVSALTPISLLDSIGLFDLIDDEWILFKSNDFSSLTDIADVNTPAQCLIDAAGDLSKYNDSVAKAYQGNQFIKYSTNNLGIAKRNDNLYLITFDAETMAGFINALATSGFMNDLNACMGNTATSQKVTASDMTEIIKSLPTIYVEVNAENLFTRVYLRTSNAEKTTDVIADIALSYPDKITITEPSSYLEGTQVIEDLMTKLFGADFTE